ncbi:helix-turn-helix domain-containing protein [Phytoactinopolyspora mesophila]|uniref:Helix-turn-helix domain-containing protein n=1 Tax=Phytoactinopolyspora mesophila TaxID=2650750 RepID=A0A7K3M157_9ACTN|nr:helix-turn-helix domain-containing protein [Phytoactinopolyspora mesophila]
MEGIENTDRVGLDRSDPNVALRIRQANIDLELVDELRRLREQLGLSQAQVAKAMGRHQTVVSTLETLGSDPRWSSIRRYAGALGVCINWRIEMQSGLSDLLARELRDCDNETQSDAGIVSSLLERSEHEQRSAGAGTASH